MKDPKPNWDAENLVSFRDPRSDAYSESNGVVPKNWTWQA